MNKLHEVWNRLTAWKVQPHFLSTKSSAVEEWRPRRTWRYLLNLYTLDFILQVKGNISKFFLDLLDKLIVFDRLDRLHRLQVFCQGLSLEFFRSSRRVKMSFLYEKGRAATFCLLLCAYRFKKGSASLVFELDDYENCRSSGCFFLFRFRPRVVNKSFARLRLLP